MEELIGYIERITYQSQETGYCVVQVQEKGKHKLTCVVGIMPSVQPGETIRFFGQWKKHLIHGLQFECEKYTSEAPADIQGIKKYLGSGLIRGIGPKYAERIVDQFGIKTFTIIDENPERLFEVPGIGKARVGKIASCWAEQKSIRDVMVFLQKYEVSPIFAQKIFKRYGKNAIRMIQENPYTLARDIIGIGFKSADRIARKMGVGLKSPERIDAGIEYALSELCNDGNVCYPIDLFLEEAAKILEVTASDVQERVDSMGQTDRVILENMSQGGEIKPFVWLRPLYIAEAGIASEIKRLTKSACSLRSVDLEKALQWVQNQLNIQLETKQQNAIRQALSNKMQIITGGPGTGKSTITNAILAITEKLTDNILLAAPTGRAAKRMTEITQRKASTIHSLLEYSFKEGKFKHNRDNPLKCDLIIIDEASMIDTLLMNHLLKAIPKHARVIFVGDIDQLPSVGPGNVLKDMIRSKQVPIILLTEIFRQAAGSQIITAAHLVNKGIYPNLRNQSQSDFFFIEAQDPEDVLKELVNIAVYRLPRKYGYHPLRDIQVLAPMRKGIIGTINLNTVLQETLNQDKNSLYHSGKQLLVGDKVMQIRNNYDKKVFNGDIGYVKAIDRVEQQVIVEFEDHLVTYDFTDLDEIDLSYAVSIHKYQGSESPCVVMPIHTSHYKLLLRNLLYTGITRAKKHLILIGSKKAIAIAVHNDSVKKRYTGLTQAIINTHSIL